MTTALLIGQFYDAIGTLCCVVGRRGLFSASLSRVGLVDVEIRAGRQTAAFDLGP